MTTKITIETGSHPVALHMHSCHEYVGPEYRNYSSQNSSEFIGPNSTYATHISKESRITIEELPEDWTSLDGPESGPETFGEAVRNRLNKEEGVSY